MYLQYFMLNFLILPEEVLRAVRALYRSSLLLALLTAGCEVSGQVVLAEYNFDNGSYEPSMVHPSIGYVSSFTGVGVPLGSVPTGSGVTGSPDLAPYVDQWPVSPVALDLSKYFQIVILAAPAHTVQVDRIRLWVNSSNGGPSTLTMRSSTNEWSSDMFQDEIGPFGVWEMKNVIPSTQTVMGGNDGAVFRIYAGNAITPNGLLAIDSIHIEGRDLTNLILPDLHNPMVRWDCDSDLEPTVVASAVSGASGIIANGAILNGYALGCDASGTPQPSDVSARFISWPPQPVIFDSSFFLETRVTVDRAMLLDTLRISTFRSSTGPIIFQIRWNVDNFSSPLYFFPTVDVGNCVTHHVNLDGVLLPGDSTIVFRYYGSSGNGSTGRLFIDDVELGGHEPVMLKARLLLAGAMGTDSMMRDDLRMAGAAID